MSSVLRMSYFLHTRLYIGGDFNCARLCRLSVALSLTPAPCRLSALSRLAAILYPRFVDYADSLLVSLSLSLRDRSCIYS